LSQCLTELRRIANASQPNAASLRETLDYVGMGRLREALTAHGATAAERQALKVRVAVEFSRDHDQ